MGLLGCESPFPLQPAVTGFAPHVGGDPGMGQRKYQLRAELAVVAEKYGGHSQKKSTLEFLLGAIVNGRNKEGLMTSVLAKVKHHGPIW